MGTVLDILKSEELKTINEQVNVFCEEVMTDYISECKDFCKKHSLSSSNTKSFYDSVWGTIEINEGEIFIIDSPIIQRLRHIRQLGIANLLYASADHSRFSHTLGVIQTADIMQKQIEKELKKQGIDTDKNVNQIIRLSAAFHDTGHMFCSHASERYFQKNDTFCLFAEIEKIRTYIYNRIDIKPSLSELLSALIVNSKSTRTLLTISSRGFDSLEIQSADLDCVIEKICCFIWGYPYSEKLFPYAQIISGQIDADKLDYLKRDSYSTGVPAAVDMSRVFQKLRVVKSDAKHTMVSTTEEGVDTVYTIAIAPAAINTVDQLIISRYMMFENVYFHQKTLTAETLLRYALECICKSTEGLLDDFRNILILQDNDVVHTDFDSVIRNRISDFIITDDALYKKACEILRDLAMRKLYKRSVAFTSENLTDVGYKVYNFYSKIFKDNNTIEQDSFVSLIREQVEVCKKLLEGTTYHSAKNTEMLLVVSPDISSVNINSNLAIAGKNNLYRDMEFEADSWLKSRSSQKPQNYLITYSDDRFIAYVASEYVLFKYYGLLINDPIIYDEKEVEYIEKIKQELDSKGYYKGAYAISPNEEIQKHSRDIERLVKESWKCYELISVDNGFPYEMNTQYLTTFIKQFKYFEEQLGEYPLFVKGCVDMLKCVRIISKQEIFSALKNNFDKISKKENIPFDNMKICNIGNVMDGSAQISYQINSINEYFQSKNSVIILEKALEFSEEGQVIVFVEDAFCSGKQIISVFETYMGIPIEERATSERHVDELSKAQKKKLKRSKLYFSFIMHNKENEDYFINRMSELGLEDVSIVSNEKFPKKYFEGRDDEGQRILKKYLESAGRLLVKQKATDNQGNRKENWTDERISNSLLGYNNAQQLIVFAWNTPTYTMTPLWLQGKVEDTDWIPLFPRINK